MHIQKLGMNQHYRILNIVLVGFLFLTYLENYNSYKNTRNIAFTKLVYVYNKLDSKKINDYSSRCRSIGYSTNMIANSATIAIASPKLSIMERITRYASSFINPSITGGFLAGGFHAISGPDHLAALMGPSIGKSGLYGFRIGAIWGIGHGISAMLLGLSAFYVKGQFTGRFVILEKLASLAESAVGISILLIGLIGIKESNEVEPHESREPQPLEVGDTLNDSLPEHTQSLNAISSSSSTNTPRSYQAILANGILHGLSWDGAPSLAPAIAMSSWKQAFTFLFSYSIGTILTMGIAAGTLGELSIRVGKVTNNPDLPRKLSFVTSTIAVFIGVYFILKSTRILP